MRVYYCQHWEKGSKPTRSSSVGTIFVWRRMTVRGIAAAAFPRLGTMGRCPHQGLGSSVYGSCHNHRIIGIIHWKKKKGNLNVSISSFLPNRSFLSLLQKKPEAVIPQHHSKLQPTEALLMAPFLHGNMEKRKLSTGKSKLYKFSHHPPAST